MAYDRYGEQQVVIEPPAPQRIPVRPAPVVTPTLIALNVLVLLAMVATGVSAISPTGEQLLAWGANFGPLTLHGQAWRLLTACFLHFGLVHLGFNMYILYQVGMTTEIIYGRGKYLLIYLLTGVAGNVVSVFIHPFGVGAGASGAIFGVYGAFLGYLLIKRNVIPKQAMAQMTQSAAVFLGISLVYGLASRSTDLSAHITGLVMGFLLGSLLTQQAAAVPRR